MIKWENYFHLGTDFVYELYFVFQSVDIPGLGFGQADYYPYVYYKLNIDMLDTKV